MDRFFRQSDRSVTDIRRAAVAIRRINDHQRHIGILHSEDGESAPRLLHLAWHHQLEDSTLSSQYCWIDPPLSPRRLRQVAAICRKVLAANPAGVPYGFDGPNDCFDAETYEGLFGTTKHGLTCATFVLAVFACAGIQLIDLDTWHLDDPADAAWQQWVVDLLREKGAEAQAVAVERQIGAARVRPEQAAAAVAIGTGNSLIKREQLATLAESIVNALAYGDSSPC